MPFFISLPTYVADDLVQPIQIEDLFGGRLTASFKKSVEERFRQSKASQRRR